MAKTDDDFMQVNVRVPREMWRHLAAIAKDTGTTLADLGRAGLLLVQEQNPRTEEEIERALGDGPKRELVLPPATKGGGKRTVSRATLQDIGRGTKEAKLRRPGKPRRSVDQPIQQDPAHPDAPTETSSDSGALPEGSAQAA